MQIQPIPQLAHLVRHFLILESPGSAKTIHTLIPDGNPGIVFHYGTPFQPFPKSFAYGQITRPHNILSTGNIGVFITVLHPHALNSLTNLPAHTFTDTAITLQQLWGPKATALEKQMLHAAGFQDRIDCIQNFLLQHLPPKDHNIAYLQQLPIGRRQLERMFKTTIGISPKQYAGILRTQQFLKAMKTCDTQNLTQLAYEFGYYDQSHLIRDFKTKTGITPGKYFAAKDTLALNFIQFPA